MGYWRPHVSKSGGGRLIGIEHERRTAMKQGRADHTRPLGFDESPAQFEELIKECSLAGAVSTVAPETNDQCA